MSRTKVHSPKALALAGASATAVVVEYTAKGVPPRGSSSYARETC